MNTAVQNIYADLKLDRDLIDSNFDGYKLSLDPLPTYRLAIETDVDVARISDDQYSYQHLKAFGNHNHLFVDPWFGDAVWFVDEQWNVRRAAVLSDTMQINLTSCYQLPDWSDRRLTPERVNVTVLFTSRDWAVVADGTGWMYIVRTGDRSHGEQWKDGFSGQPLGSNVHFTLLHGILHTEDKTEYIDVMCLHVEKNPVALTDVHASNFITKLSWLTFSSDNDTSFSLSRTRTLETSSCPDYVSIDPRGTSVIIVSEKPVRFIEDSLKPITTSPPVCDLAESSTSPAYTWTQTSSEIIVQFKLATNVCKSEVNFSLTASHVDLKLAGGAGDSDNVLLNGDLCGLIDVDNSTWTLNDNNVLELTLFKVAGSDDNSTDWKMVVLGDDRGERIFTAEQLTDIDQRLAPFTSDILNGKPESEDKKPAFNAQQLEECDAVPEEDAAIWCYDGESHKLNHQVNISSHQWLFSATSPSPDESPVMCLRHDVDGVIWQPTVSPTDTTTTTDPLCIVWKHVATFNAFGYVQASKQSKKYTTCAPDFSYVVIADDVRHMYVYRQPAAIANPLRNRKTGEKVTSVAKQQLISLESVTDILGVRATSERIFAVSGKTLYAVTTKT